MGGGSYLPVVLILQFYSKEILAQSSKLAWEGISDTENIAGSFLHTTVHTCMMSTHMVCPFTYDEPDMPHPSDLQDWESH